MLGRCASSGIVQLRTLDYNMGGSRNHIEMATSGMANKKGPPISEALWDRWNNLADRSLSFGFLGITV